MKSVQKAALVVAIVGMALMGTASAALAQDSVNLGTTLTGAAEVGDPGDPDGFGTAAITIDNAAGQVCFDMTINLVDTLNAAHIHSGGAGSNGDVVVNLDYPANGNSGCVDASEAMRNSITNTPTLFYVNVHNEAFPGGALRGQLALADAGATTTATTTTTTGAQELAFTGTSLTGILALAGAGLVASGAVMVRTSRKED